MFTVIERLRALRIAEGLSELEFAEQVGIPYVSYAQCEHGVREFTAADFLKITKHPRFEKYTLWLLSGKAAPAAGQIAAHMQGDECWMDTGREAKTVSHPHDNKPEKKK